MDDRTPARRLDRDLDRAARRTGRPTIAGALTAAFVSGGTLLIDWIYGGHPTILAWVAVGSLVWFVCPALVIEALRWRRSVWEWAQEQQRHRDEAQPPPAAPRRRRTVNGDTGRVTALHEGRPTTQRGLARGKEGP